MGDKAAAAILVRQWRDEAAGLRELGHEVAALHVEMCASDLEQAHELEPQAVTGG